MKISSLDIHQVSLLNCYYNFDIGHVGSLIPLLVLCIDNMHSPIYWS